MQVDFKKAHSSPIFLFNKQYNTPFAESQFQHDFETLVWFSYRKRFAPLLATPKPGKTKRFTSDVGWGCMLRCGQMLLARALMQNEEVRFSPTARTAFRHLARPVEAVMDEYRMKRLNLLRKFVDSERAPAAPFSISEIAIAGRGMGKQPGDWYGTNSISQVLASLNERHKPVPGF